MLDSNPKPKKSQPLRKAVFFGLATIFLPIFIGIINLLIRLITDPVSLEKRSWDNYLGLLFAGFGAAMLSFILSIITIITSISALRKGERSRTLWLVFIPSILICTFWTLMILGEILFPH